MRDVQLGRVLFWVHMVAIVAVICLAWWQTYHHKYVWWEYMTGIGGLTVLRMIRNHVERVEEREVQPREPF
ncbi:hypothetical protein [Novosphingobium terrae]|uniref:hypothetical protein n=1 Tax=Novosphingobium terrae TaxID=2726189 RepID=UPI00197D7332|nr:hypothetical protein [Novosphingobium terrae]